MLSASDRHLIVFGQALVVHSCVQCVIKLSEVLHSFYVISEPTEWCSFCVIW